MLVFDLCIYFECEIHNKIWIQIWNLKKEKKIEKKNKIENNQNLVVGRLPYFRPSRSFGSGGPTK
jgi:hypothetical protein